MGCQIDGYRATKDLLSICWEAEKITTYMDRQGKATVVYYFDLYMMVSVSRTINHQSAYLDCISLNEAEFRSWGLSVNYQCGSVKAYSIDQRVGLGL